MLCLVPSSLRKFRKAESMKCDPPSLITIRGVPNLGKIISWNIFCDEPMASQIIDTENYYVNSNKSIGDFSKSSIPFGVFSRAENYVKRNIGICASAIFPSSIFFIGANLPKQHEKQFMQIGSMLCEIKEIPTYGHMQER